MNNPYSGVSFESQIIGVTHAHCVSQAEFERLYNSGIKHFAISNYYPSAPVYPLSELFSNVPDDAISCPNAEFAHFIASPTSLHLNGLGSTWSAGNEEDTSPDIGWRESIGNILQNLLYADGGGVTINHPVWSRLPTKKCIEILDFDERVLGIEIINTSLGNLEESLRMWDSILSTGRKCYGFAVPDHYAQTHSTWVGFESILSTADNQSCLQSYRNGAFYSRVSNTNLVFTAIGISGKTLSVTTDNAESIKIVTNNGVQETQGNSATYTHKSNDVYIRVEATNSEDRIFSNAIMLKEHKKEQAFDMILNLD